MWYKIKKPFRKMIILTGGLFALWGASMWIATELKANMEYYLTPHQVDEEFLKTYDGQKNFRVGGQIESGSIKIDAENHKIYFVVRDVDEKFTLNIIYDGLVTPPLFKEGVGCICYGYYDQDKNIFFASKLIGKHDEYYMPNNK